MTTHKKPFNIFGYIKLFFIKFIIYHREKAASSRFMTHLNQAMWQMYGKEQAKAMLYYNGRIVGREMMRSVKRDYKVKGTLSWDDLLNKIELFGSIFSLGKVKVAEHNENSAVIRFWNSPCCNVSVTSDSFCCDFVAGFLAALPSFAFEGANTRCKEISCKGYDKTKNYCDFLLEVDWLK